MIKHTSLIALIALLATACEQGSPDDSSETTTTATTLATAKILDREGNSVGLASLIEADTDLAINVSLSNMPEGEKALHLHSVGTCTAPDFKSAEGHLNPSGATHGKLSERGPHMGDLPNVYVAFDGLAEVSLPIEGSSSSITQAIFDEDGTAVVIHEGPDDYQTDPAGAAGARIACGEFEAN